jgi:hypothetical protein
MIIPCDTLLKLNQGTDEIIAEVVEILQREPQTICLTKLTLEEDVRAIEDGVGNRMGHPNLHSVSSRREVVFWFEK